MQCVPFLSVWCLATILSWGTKWTTWDTVLYQSTIIMFGVYTVQQIWYWMKQYIVDVLVLHVNCSTSRIALNIVFFHLWDVSYVTMQVKCCAFCWRGGGLGQLITWSRRAGCTEWFCCILSQIAIMPQTFSIPLCHTHCVDPCTCTIDINCTLKKM